MAKLGDLVTKVKAGLAVWQGQRLAAVVHVEGLHDPWVEQIAKSAMLETDYWIAIQHVELRTKLGDIPKECELSEMSGSFNDLSVTTIKGGKTLIFRSKHRNYDS